jgi:putative transcriptional regulator
MSKAFESIKWGLEEAIEHASGKKKLKVHKPAPVDVKEVRHKIGMSQPEFAATFGISLGTLRHWERGDRSPHGPALILLHVITKEPKAVLRAIGEK